MITVDSLEQYTGSDLQTLVIKATVTRLEHVFRDRQAEAYARRQYGVRSKKTLQTAIQAEVQQHLALYQDGFAAKKVAFTAQAQYCLDLALNQGFIATSKDIHIVILDSLLLHGSPIVSDANQYDHDTNTILIEIQQPNQMLAHEVGHCLSADMDNCRLGFIYFEFDQTGQRIGKGNQWLNEGTTIIWEELSTNDGSSIPSRKKKWDMYGWYRAATKLLLQEIDVIEDTLLRAYFGQAQYRQPVLKKIEQRFGATIEELDCLMLRLEPEWTAQILRGEPVIADIHKNLQQEVQDQYKKLATIFPNVTLEYRD
jgi:hypothetical protein